MDSNKIMWNIDNLSKIYISHQCHHCTHRRSAALVGKKGVSWYQAKPIQNPTLRAGPRHNRPTSALEHLIPGCSFAVPRPVSATEPRRRCHGASQRHRPADPVWACQLNEGEGSTGQSKNTGMIYSKIYNKTCFNSSLPGQKGHNFTDDFSNEFTWMKSFILWFNFYWCLFLRAQLTNKSALVDNKSMLVQAMDWHRVGDKPLPDTVHCRIEEVGMSWRGLTRINI